jgi:superoxide dismutase, Fe-Mn family
MDDLRETFLNTAEAMFGPGFVWLVQTHTSETVADRDVGFRILATYLAGSPLPGAHWRMQPMDMNTQNVDSLGGKLGNTAESNARLTMPQNNVGAFGSGRFDHEKPRRAPGGANLTPLLCVNTWEHVWLMDYGIKGKRQYLEKWWDYIDWHKVEKEATITQRSTNRFLYQPLQTGSKTGGNKRLSV